MFTHPFFICVNCHDLYFQTEAAYKHLDNFIVNLTFIGF